MKRFSRTFLFAILAGIFVMSSTACNTVEGMGEDIERGGEEIQEAAE